eukprot:sb/3466307/
MGEGVVGKLVVGDGVDQARLKPGNSVRPTPYSRCQAVPNRVVRQSARQIVNPISSLTAATLWGVGREGRWGALGVLGVVGEEWEGNRVVCTALTNDVTWTVKFSCGGWHLKNFMYIVLLPCVFLPDVLLPKKQTKNLGNRHDIVVYRHLYRPESTQFYKLHPLDDNKYPLRLAGTPLPGPLYAGAERIPASLHCYSLYPYRRQNDDELKLRESDIITITEQSDPNWWIGKLGGDVGLFPVTYVEMINDHVTWETVRMRYRTTSLVITHEKRVGGFPTRENDPILVSVIPQNSVKDTLKEEGSYHQFGSIASYIRFANNMYVRSISLRLPCSQITSRACQQLYFCS